MLLANEQEMPSEQGQNAPDLRIVRLRTWLDRVCGGNVISIQPASNDASFRRYFRVTLAERTLIAMDAPPATENIRSFVRVGALFRKAGVCVPEIIAFDEEQGFMLLGDLGFTSYLSQLDTQNAPQLYRDAMRVLNRLHHNIDIQTSGLPDYDRALLQREVNLFEEWFLNKKLAIELSGADTKSFEGVKAFLIDAILKQPKVVVHRDFHSRNLMVIEGTNPGVLDFQDAVAGPVSYDLVSLLRDCYIAWPEEAVEGWVREFHSSLDSRAIGFEQFYRGFDLTGLQRHLKAVGIFARLSIRDGKSGYLQDIPRTLGYVQAVSAKYRELSFLHHVIETQVAEGMARILQS
ncbi:MAG: aminoglycoside phosphotransferase family protein [Methylococcales bacterium]